MTEARRVVQRPVRAKVELVSCLSCTIGAEKSEIESADQIDCFAR